MEEDSTRTPAGNLPQIFADRSPWHDKASSARLAPSSLAQQITTRDEKCTAADELGVAVWKRDQPDNRDDQAHPEKFLPSASDAKQAWHNRSQLEMRRARQRDELNVAVWKWGQPDNQWDDQAHPEKFLLHMYIGATVFAIYIYILPLCLQSIFIYCHYSSTQLRLPTGSVLVWMKSPLHTYICVWYIYILPLFVHPTPLAYWECNCVDESLLDIYIYYLIYILFDTYICVWYIYIAPIRLLIPLTYWECNCADEVAFSIQIFFIGYVYMCLIYIYVATIRIPNSACQNWECNCVDEVACSIYIYFCRCCLCVHLWLRLQLSSSSAFVYSTAYRQGVCLCGQSCCLIRIYVSVLYIFCHSSCTQLRLPKLGV